MSSKYFILAHRVQIYLWKFSHDFFWNFLNIFYALKTSPAFLD